MRAAVRGRLTALALAAALALGTLALYRPVGTFAFLGLDDDVSVTANPQVRAGLSAATLRWSLTAFTAYNWQPLTWWSHLLDVRLFGLDAGRHHLVSAGLHALNAALLLLLLRGMTGALWPAVATAALFALHPLRVESVAWVAERKDVLSAALWLLATAAYVRWCRRPTAAGQAATAAALALGLMAKPMLVTLPFTLLLLDAWPLGRAVGPHRVRWPRLLLEKAPLFALAAAASALTLLAQRSGGAVLSLAAEPLPRRLANAVVAGGWYLGKLVWPSGLTVLRLLPPGGWPALAILAGGAALLAGGAAALLLRRRAPYVAVGWCWYLGTLVPVVGLVQVGVQAVADRYTYVPLIGVGVALAWGARDLVRAWRVPRAVPAALGCAAAAALAAATAAQLPHWRDSESLFARVLAVDPSNFVANNNLGLLRASQGRHEEAIALFRASLAQGRSEARPRYNLGVALGALGRHEEALREFTAALRGTPSAAAASQAQLGIATTLIQLGRTAEAGVPLERAVALDPGNETAAHNLRVWRERYRR